MEIALDSYYVSGNEIRYKLHVSKPLRKYFINDASYIQYDSNVDIQDINGSILVIPIVANIAPIAWAVGADVHLNKIDATYFQALKRVKDAYRNMHSNFSFSGDIHAEEIVRNEFEGSRTGILFTGGVDSLTSYVRHRQKKPDLISVWGLPDIYPFEDKFGNRMWADVGSFADQDGLESIHIKTDMLSNINRELLSREYGLSWFREAAFGMFLLGLCAPVTATRKMDTIIIASGRTEDCKGPSGSLPSIDNHVSWADVKVVHDGYEISRQQKLRYLCNAENSRYLAHLRVCWEWAFENNCGNCEKCFRTITGLALEGVDPNSCNFDVKETTFPYIMNRFLKGEIALEYMPIFMWGDIQKHIPDQIDTDTNGSREFLKWLKGYDLSKHKANKLRTLIWDANRLYRSRRIKVPAIIRKIKCYYYIALTRMKLL